jgi:uncharacterized damage-inducible protein DinB
MNSDTPLRQQELEAALVLKAAMLEAAAAEEQLKAAQQEAAQSALALNDVTLEMLAIAAQQRIQQEQNLRRGNRHQRRSMDSRQRTRSR